jgi:hypothetical protein
MHRPGERYARADGTWSRLRSPRTHRADLRFHQSTGEVVVKSFNFIYYQSILYFGKAERFATKEWVR